MTLVLAITAVCFFMFWQDGFGSGLTISQSRGLRFFPGLFDGLGDFVSRYGTGVSAFAVVKYGLTSWQFLLITFACGVTSFFTSNMATEKQSLLLPKDRLEKVSLREMWTRLRKAF